MELKKRAFTKALTWQLIGFVVMTAINYAYIGDFQSGLGLSSLLTAVGVVSYYFHERLRSHLEWGLSDGG